jgi:hypothetical protein
LLGTLKRDEGRRKGTRDVERDENQIQCFNNKIFMKDRLDEIRFYNLAIELWNETWKDTEILMLDFRGKEISRQLIRAVGSISANIEEGYERGFGRNIHSI